MPVIAAIAASAILLALAVLQVAVAAGAPLGRFVWGGRHTVPPRGLRVASAASIALYAVFAIVLLGRAGVIDWLPDALTRVGAWVIFGYSVLGIGLNAISRSPSERWTMVPVCTALAVLSLLVALG